MSALQLKKFDMTMLQQLTTTPVIAIIGDQQTGKTTLIKDIISYFPKYSMGTVISHDTSFSQISPPVSTHTEYNQEILRQVIINQRKVMQKDHAERKTYRRLPIHKRTFLVMDDVLAKNSWVNDKFVRDVYLNGRSWEFMFILSTRYPYRIPPLLRSNIDFIFIFNQPSEETWNRIYENYAGKIPTYETFFDVFSSQITEKYTCLVIKNYPSHLGKWQDSVFWYRIVQDDYVLK